MYLLTAEGSQDDDIEESSDLTSTSLTPNVDEVPAIPSTSTSVMHEDVGQSAASGDTVATTPVVSKGKRPKKWAKRPASADADTLSRQVDEAMLEHLRKGQHDDDDEVMLFCRSLAPKLRKLNQHQFLCAQMGILTTIQNIMTATTGTGEFSIPPAPIISNNPPAQSRNATSPPEGREIPNSQWFDNLAQYSNH